MRFPERRTGFDRRTAESAGAVLRFLDRGVRLLAHEPWRLATLLVLLLALGWLDLAFTLDALASGATEVNPLMARLLAEDVRLAAAFKLGITAAVVTAIWKWRSYRRVLEATLAIVGCMLALLAYHIALQALMA